MENNSNKQPIAETESQDEMWDDVRAYVSQTYDVDDIMKNLKSQFTITKK